MSTTLSGPSVTRFVPRVQREGFLAAVGGFWAEHGDTFAVSIGRKKMVFAMHPDAVEYVNINARKRYGKGASYDNVRDFITGKGLVGSTGELWKRQRRLMAPFFTTQGIQQFAEVMLEDALVLAARWEQLAEKGAQIDVADEMTSVTASIILRTMFSSSTMDDTGQIRHAVETLVSFSNGRMVLPSLPLWVPTAHNQRYKAARELVHGTIQQVIEERRAMPEADWPDDLLSRLMQVRDEETGAPMSEELLRDESLTVFVAGHETTARTMTFAFYALARAPEVMARLQAELHEVLGGRPPTIAELRRLPYTLQVVKEVLRLYPAAPFYARDALVDDEIGGFSVPKDASVMLSPYYTHRHPDFWPDPERFDPERWTPEAEAARHRYAFHPFAAGPRVCIGNNFSLLETHLLLAVLAQRVLPELLPGYRTRVVMRGVLSLEDPLPMTLRPA